MKTFREYLQIVLNEEDAPPGGPPPGGPPDLGGPPPGGPPMGGPPDAGGIPGAPPMGGAPAGGEPKTKLDVYEVWRDLEEFLGTTTPDQNKKTK